jgi:hypothetical protein
MTGVNQHGDGAYSTVLKTVNFIPQVPGPGDFIIAAYLSPRPCITSRPDTMSLLKQMVLLHKISMILQLTTVNEKQNWHTPAGRSNE